MVSAKHVGSVTDGAGTQLMIQINLGGDLNVRAQPTSSSVRQSRSGSREAFRDDDPPTTDDEECVSVRCICCEINEMIIWLTDEMPSVGGSCCVSCFSRGLVWIVWNLKFIAGNGPLRGATDSKCLMQWFSIRVFQNTVLHKVSFMVCRNI